MVGLERQEHVRTNRLHQEELGQMLRVHEAEVMAAQEFHRREVHVSNEHHACKNKQERYFHEEDIDLEKHVALRDNFRDDWQRLSSRAEVVLIVNTLLLASAFAMIIEGHLPEAATLVAPELTVAYLCSTTISICLFFCSVRFAMVFRFRVGKIIVAEMRTAIAENRKMDKEFREFCIEKRISQPSLVRAVCRQGDQGDLERERKRRTASRDDQKEQERREIWDCDFRTRSLPYHVRHVTKQKHRHWITNSRWHGIAKSMCRHKGAKGDRNAKCLCNVCSSCPRGFEDAKYLAHASDSITEWNNRPRPLPMKAPDQKEQGLSIEDVNLNVDGDDEFLEFLEGDDEFLTPRGEEDTTGGALALSEDTDAQDVMTSEEPLHSAEAAVGTNVASSLDSASPVAIPVFISSDDEISDDEARYRKEFLDKRFQGNKERNQNLEELRKKQCTPWQEASYILVAAGSCMLLAAACLLVFGRFFRPSVPPMHGERSYPASPWSFWACLMTFVLTVTFLCLMQVLLEIERPKGCMRRMLKSHKLEDSEEDNETEACEEETEETNNKAQSKADECAITIACCLICLLVFVPLPVFTILAGCEKYDVTWRSWKDGPLQSTSTVRLIGQLEVPLTEAHEMQLAPEAHWPSFWEPSGAVWLPAEDSLLLLGNSGAMTAAIMRDSAGGGSILSDLSPLQALHAATDAPLVDFCFAKSVAEANSGWLITIDRDMILRLTSFNGSGNLFGSWRSLNASAVLSLHDDSHQPRRIACRSLWNLGYVPVTHGPEHMHPTLELWTATNKAGWPVVVGGHAELNVWSEGRSIQSSPLLHASLHWPLRWLLTNHIAAEVLKHSTPSPAAITIESIDAKPNGGLLLLVTVPLSGPLLQLLVAIHANGHLQHCWPLAGPKRTGARWIALASVAEDASVTKGTSHSRVFLVAGGQSPVVAEMRLPMLSF